MKVKLGALAMILLCLPAACTSADGVSMEDDGCPSGGDPDAHVDWSDAVNLGGVIYEAEGPAKASQVGDVHARSRCRLDGAVTDHRYEPKDGDATYAPPGTAFHEVQGFDPSGRLAAHRNKSCWGCDKGGFEWILYKAQEQ